jgi:hypothetical protein
MQIQLPSEHRINLVFEWSISAGTGHPNTGPFENLSNLSGFLMVRLAKIVLYTKKIFFAV